MEYAPIIIPTLCRSKHFIRLIESLKNNSWACYTDVIVGVDYPPSDKYKKGWEEICNYLDNGDFSSFNDFIVFKHDRNLGAGKNNNYLVDYVLERYNSWIRCDDDCEFSPNFLEYMDKCLDRYKDDPKVVAVNGYSYPINWASTKESTCFLQDFTVSTWGVGVWKNKRAEMREYIVSKQMLKDASKVIKSRRFLSMIDSTFIEYFEGVLRLFNKSSLMIHETDCAMTSYLSCAGKRAVTPILSKVRNHGFDGSGLYCVLTEGDGSSARSMVYSDQIIDQSTSFNLIPNEEKWLPENRRRMNEFDCVSASEMKTAKMNFWMIEHFGYILSVVIHLFIAIKNRIKKLL